MSATAKSKVVHENQLSFMSIFDATESEYDLISADSEHNYELRFSSKMAYEIIRDSIYIMTAYRSTGEQRVDEIFWICSEENQEDLCSFTSCCKIAGLDPFETRMEILHEWSSELAKQARLIACHHFTAPTNMEHVASQRIGYEKYRKAFYHTYPKEAAKPLKNKPL
ncbi:TPA: hypothetical protein R8G25_003952 [Citrobacter freundii]|nr:hypothetical protein [Citrobacter freundii]